LKLNTYVNYLLTIIKLQKFVYSFRPDELSKAVDEVIDEINASDEEVIDEPKSKSNKPSKRKRKSAKEKHKQLIEELKNSLSVGNQSVGAIEKHNFDKLRG
jgi:hypothetical protein